MSRSHPARILSRSLLALIAAALLGCGAAAPAPAPASAPAAPSAPPPAAPRPFVHTWKTLTFSTPVPFSAPTKIGLDAVALLNPPMAGLGDARFSIVLVELSPQMQKSMGVDDAGLFDYVKTTFLATARPPSSHRERSILGRVSRGALFQQRIPKASQLEAHLLPLADGTRIALAFRHDVGMPAAEAAAIIEAVCASLATHAR